MARMTPKRRNTVHRPTPKQRPRAFSGTAGLVGLAVLGTAVAGAPAQANPEGGTVVGGSATISTSGPGQLDVRQQTDKAIIDWRSFGIGAGETTAFQQPSPASVALNRVTGLDPSTLLGNLTANGNVFLINPNGVLFGSGARIDVGGLVATTSDIANQDFMAGLYRFDIPSPNPNAMVINRGMITVAERGLAALVAPGVENSGVIQARLGRVALAGSETFTLDLTGDGLLTFGVGAAVADAPAGAGTLVTNSGSILADGGTVLLTAGMAAGVLSNAINMSGVIEARAASVDQSGTIILSGGASGLVEVSGTLDVSGTGTGETGGRVKVLGDLVALRDNSMIAASGDAGGGTVLVGGDYQGKGDMPTARRTLVEVGVAIAADAITSGDGGTVIAWADEVARFDGRITARGGGEGGDGGFVETSSGNVLQILSGQVDAGATNGANGTWLLDPDNINVIGSTRERIEAPPDILFAEAFNEGFELSPDVLASSLNVAVGTTAVLQAEIDINILTDVTTSGGSLVFQAGNNITILGDTSIQTSGGNLYLEADSPYATGGSDNEGAIIVKQSGAGTDLNGFISTKGGDLTMIAADFDIGGLVDAGVGNVSTSTTNGLPLALGAPGAPGTPDLTGVELDNIVTTGVLTLGRATTAGSDGRGADAQTLFAGPVIVEANVTKSDVAALVLASSGSVSSGYPDQIVTRNLAVIAGGPVDLAGTADTLAISAPSQTVDFFSFNPVNVGSVAGITGIDAFNLDLRARGVTFLVDHAISGGGVHDIRTFLSSDVVFKAPVEGPGALFVDGAGDTIFQASVGQASPLKLLVIGGAFVGGVLESLSQGVEAAADQVFNGGHNAIFDGLVRAGTLIVRVFGEVTSGSNSANALDVGGLLVSGTGATLFGGVAGDFSNDTAASRAFSDDRRIDFGEGFDVEPIDPKKFTLNGCVIETLCVDKPILPPVDPNNRTRIGSNELLPVAAQLLEPTLNFTEIFVPVTEQRETSDERFSNLGNEEIW